MPLTVSHQDLKSYFGDADHLELSQEKSFSETIFLSLFERAPREEELKVFELILNLSIDHGPDTPSAIPAIEAAKNRSSISEALSAGILQINDFHGGAGEKAMEIFYEIRENERPFDSDQINMAKIVVERKITSGEKIQGYGHRLYKDSDPRAEMILDYCQKLENSSEFIRIAREVSEQLTNQTGKKLPLNIDGAIAVAFCCMDTKPVLAKAVFLIARVPGLIAHILNSSN